MKKILFYLCLFSLLLTSCSKEDASNLVAIRVNNQTGKDISDVSVYSWLPNVTGEFERKYGKVKAGETSKYQSHKEVAWYPLYKLTMDGQTIEYRLLYCGVGITYLQPGKYSLLIQEIGNQMSIRFIED